MFLIPASSASCPPGCPPFSPIFLPSKTRDCPKRSCPCSYCQFSASALLPASSKSCTDFRNSLIFHWRVAKYNLNLVEKSESREQMALMDNSILLWGEEKGHRARRTTKPLPLHQVGRLGYVGATLLHIVHHRWGEAGGAADLVFGRKYWFLCDRTTFVLFLWVTTMGEVPVGHRDAYQT